MAAARARRLAASQIKLIAVARRRLGLADDDYRSLMRRVAGVNSATQLSQRGFSDLMEELNRLGFTSSSARKPYAGRNRPGFATNAQVTLIRRLWLEWAESGAGYRGLDSWIERTFGVSSLRFLSLDDAPGAIAALRAMAARRAGADPPAA